MKKIPLFGPLGEGSFTIVDDDTFSQPYATGYKWHLKPSGYVYVSPGVYLHRLITSPPPGYEVDHINGDKLDNRRSNLRVCTHAQNSRNRRIPLTATYKGVTPSGSNRWRSAICCDSVRHYLGTFSSPEDAALAYDAAALQLFDEYANLNIIGRQS